MSKKEPKMTCACGAQMLIIRYKDGKKTCDRCSPVNLSGSFLRRMEAEKQHYAKDLLQPGDDGFKELYGEGKNVKKQ